MLLQEVLVLVLFVAALFFLGYRSLKRLKSKKACSSCEAIKKA